MKLSMKAIAQIMNDNTNEDVHVSVGGVWEDYGAQMWWTTILVKSDNGRSFQALSPRQHKEIEDGVFTLVEVEELIESANSISSIK